MWIKFIKDFDGSKAGDVVWSPDKKAGQWLKDNNYVQRCLGPDGVPEQYFPPEDVIGAYAKEDGVTFEEEELIQKKKRIDYGESNETLTAAEAKKIEKKFPAYYDKTHKTKAYTTEEVLEGEVINP